MGCLRDELRPTGTECAPVSVAPLKSSYLMDVLLPLPSVRQRHLPDVPVSEPSGIKVPLVVLSEPGKVMSQPVQAGIPFPRGVLREPVSLVVSDLSDTDWPTQTEVL